LFNLPISGDHSRLGLVLQSSLKQEPLQISCEVFYTPDAFPVTQLTVSKSIVKLYHLIILTQEIASQ